MTTAASKRGRIRTVDFATVEEWSTAGQVRLQNLGGDEYGDESSLVNFVVNPPGKVSPFGLHTHAHEQAFFIISGTMSCEIGGNRYQAGPGSLVVHPDGVPHHNWNEGTETILFVAFNTPIPDPDKPRVKPYSADQPDPAAVLPGFNPVRQADLSAPQRAISTGELSVQNLIGRDSGARNSIINFCACPPGQGSPEGLHRHDHEQMFYIVSGTLNLEIAGERLVARRGDLVVTPRGAHHRNWNDGADCAVFVGFNAPIPTGSPS